MPQNDASNKVYESPDYVISYAEGPEDLEAASALIQEYTSWLGIDLSYQDYKTELASMPGKYSPSAGGCLLLARRKLTNQPLGCAAMRALPNGQTQNLSEMKRLYVAPEGRRYGLGKQLALATVEEARKLGYSEMYLDTLPFMDSAIKLYESLGFRKVKPYYDTPRTETIFLAKKLV